ncbi:DoxX family protein [Propionibacteriaceae bacterium Y1685]
MGTSTSRTILPANALGGALIGMGILHVAKPKPFDAIIPRRLPGSPRFWTTSSGVAELAVGGLLMTAPTRRLGGALAAGLFVAVWPANFVMTLKAHRAGRRRQFWITVARLPLQVPLIALACRIARG